MEYNEKYFGYSRNEMLPFIPKNIATSLEIGCGSGIFSSKLTSRNIETWGIEPVESALTRAKLVLKNALLGTFDDHYQSLPQHYFDVIIFNDVLEHIEDPWTVLHQCKTLLKTGGCIVASIPNILYFPAFLEFLINKDFKYTVGGTFDKTHLRFFTKKSIVDLFQEAGFEIKKIEGIHEYKSAKFTLFNLLTFRYFSEMKYMQYGVNAKALE